MIKYTPLATKPVVIRRDNDDGTHDYIPSDKRNRDYQAYLKAPASKASEAKSSKKAMKPHPKAKPPKKAKKK
jgi:hypothetical protein